MARCASWDYDGLLGMMEWSFGHDLEFGNDMNCVWLEGAG
jgi:hypothetical protein